MYIFTVLSPTKFKGPALSFSALPVYWASFQSAYLEELGTQLIVSIHRGNAVDTNEVDMKHWYRLLLFITSLNIICGERLSDQIYLDLTGGKYSCFRLLNGTHEIGCSSEEEGNEGVIVYADSADQLINLIASLDFVDRIIIVFDILLLNERIIGVLKDNRIRGILLLFNNSAVTSGFSEDAFCPNEQFDLNGKCENRWNEPGALLPEGFRFINWKNQFLLLKIAPKSISSKASWCYEAFNKNLKGPVLCSARMKHFMRAAGNAQICLQRQRLFYGFSDTSISLCDPLGDKNLFATMDSFSSFTEAAVGEVSVLTSLISLLAVAKTIANHSNEFEAVAQRNGRAIIFAFFMVKRHHKGEFPLDIRLTDIDSFIEVQQLDGSEPAFSAHIDSISYDSPPSWLKLQILLDAAKSSLKQSESKNDGNRRGSKISIERKARLPPSSYQSFLKEKRNIAGFVLRPYGQQYIYNRINSLEDQNVFKNGTTKLRKQIIAAASAVMGAVTGFLTGGNETEIDLFSSCPAGLFLNEGTYVSVGRNNYSLIRILMTMLIVNVLGSKNAVNVPDRSQCEDLNKHHKIYHYTWQYDPEDKKFTCYRNSLYITAAESPAFKMDGYNMHSGVYSTWVESVWTTKQLKLFLTVHHCFTRDVIVFFSGFIFFIISLIVMELIYLGNKEAIEPTEFILDSDYNPSPL
ncbi:hypothetical protein DINM_022084 [Dirofilaria immitis]|nr:hypothetical protein [Dirofilaria immitis]